ncbi:MAG: zinc ribbon domain-containing protein [Hyphomicrobiales bacterium]|nr:MAG: zinc ribbon domain-containing protein [Hyphomicrobiales bacterium]
MMLLFWWLVLPIIPAMIAHSKGRSAVGFYIYGFLLWPIALVHSLVMTRSAEAVQQRLQAEGRRPCPSCAEMIMQAASKCPHCQADLQKGWSVGR